MVTEASLATRFVAEQCVTQPAKHKPPQHLIDMFQIPENYQDGHGRLGEKILSCKLSLSIDVSTVQPGDFDIGVYLDRAVSSETEDEAVL